MSGNGGPEPEVPSPQVIGEILLWLVNEISDLHRAVARLWIIITVLLLVDAAIALKLS